MIFADLWKKVLKIVLPCTLVPAALLLGIGLYCYLSKKKRGRSEPAETNWNDGGSETAAGNGIPQPL